MMNVNSSCLYIAVCTVIAVFALPVHGGGCDGHPPGINRSVVYVNPYTTDTVVPEQGTKQYPFRAFKDAVKVVWPFRVLFFPLRIRPGLVSIQPGHYDAVDTYKKPMTIRRAETSLNSSLPKQEVVLGKPIVSMSRIRELAPIVNLHRNESYFPDDPIAFIQASRFRHHRGSGKKDEGYNKNTKRWERNNDHGDEYFNIPVGVINSYTLHDEQGVIRNRRVYDDNAGDHCNVFLEPGTQCHGKREGFRVPTLDAPCFYRVIQIPSKQKVLVQYWFFYGYNNHVNKHQGDWENITVVLNSHAQEEYYLLAAHGKPDRYDKSELETDKETGRVIVYSAKGSHATYPRAGRFTLKTIVFIKVSDNTDRGTRWDTSKNLQKLNDQPWRDFAGAWGEIGDGVLGIKASDFTGPLGPWLKEIHY